MVVALENPSKGESLFSDTSLFDDGTEQRTDKVAGVHYSKAVNCMKKGIKESDNISSQESTDTGFSESEVKAETGDKVHVQYDSNPAHSSDEQGNKLVNQKSSSEEMSFKALEIFAKFADTMSYLDAFCPNPSSVQQMSSQSDCWQASCKPGLSDEYVTLIESSDWLIQDTCDCIRGSLEVANLDYCRASVKSLSQNLKGMAFSNKNLAPDDCTVVSLEKETQGFDLLSIHLPPRVCNTVLHLDTIGQEEKSVKANRMKLYKSLTPCIPSIYHCNHRLVACDYIPALRLLCHLERLREEAHLKRRFLHYLSSNSFSLSRTTMDALADCYLGYK